MTRGASPAASCGSTSRRDGVAPPDDLQPGQAQRARPRDPRRDRRRGRATLDAALHRAHRRATGCSPRATTSATSREDVFAERGREARRAPVHRARSTRSTPTDVPTRRRAQRPRDRRRAGAGAGLRPARRRRRHQARHAAGQARARLLAHRACGASSTRSARRARASCSCSGATSTRPTALDWGLVNAVVRRRELARRGARAGDASSPPTRRCRVRGNKRVIRELLRAEGALDPRRRAELIELREACFALARTCARACARSPRSARRAGAGAEFPQRRSATVGGHARTARARQARLPGLRPGPAGARRRAAAGAP